MPHRPPSPRKPTPGSGSLPPVAMRFPRPAFFTCLIAALVAEPLALSAEKSAPTAITPTASARRIFNLDAGDAVTSLDLFADQAGIALVFLVEQVRGTKTNAVRGEFTPHEALEQMLSHTGLTIAEDTPSGALTVKRIAPAQTEKNPTTPMKSAARKNPLAVLTGWLALALAPGQTAAAADNAAIAGAHQTGAITGRVFDQGSGNYVLNARVTVEGTNIETFTDDAGYFRLDRVPAGEVQVRVFYTGLGAQARAIAVAAGQTAQQDFALLAPGAQPGSSDRPVKLEKFVVATGKEMDGAAIAINEQRFARNMVTVVSADEFGMVAEGNAAEFLKFLPGVTIEYAGGDARGVSLNGVGSSYVPVSVGGFDLANLPASGNNRNLDFNGVSINNVARVEVTNSNTPETSGSSLAGSINMVPRSAFERARPLFTGSAYVMFRDNDRSLKKQPGPNDGYNYHVNPGADFSYIVPVNSRFGFTLTGGYSKQVAPQDLLQNTWTGVSGAASANLPAPGVASPYLSSIQMGDRPRITSRTSAGLTVDYKLSPADRLSFSSSWTQFDTANYNRAIRFMILRVTPGNFGPTFTHGATGTGAGQLQNGVNARRWTSTTYAPSLVWRHNGPVWKAEAGAGYSASTTNYQDIDQGYFRGEITAVRNNVSISFDDVSFIGPGRITVRDGVTGAPIDPYSLTGYTMSTVGNISDYRDHIEHKRSVYGNLRRDFNWGRVPISIKGGFDVRHSNRDISGGTIAGNYTGPANIPASLVDVPNSSRMPPFGYPLTQWLSTEKTAQLYKEHPEYFRPDANAIYRSIVNLERNADEVITSGFLRVDAQFFERRLKLTGGYRAEQTNVQGEGPLTDFTRAYRRDASGNVIRVNNVPQLIVPTNAGLEYSKLTIISRGGKTEKEYLRVLPSINGSYNLRENLILRGAFYQSLGRPSYNQYYAGTTLPDTELLPNPLTNRISVNNPGIKAWSANTYRFSLEHYFEGVGQLSVAVFRRDFRNFFGSIVQRVTPALLDQLELDPATYGPYDIATNYNLPTRVRSQGVDFSYKQALTFLPPWARGVQVFANVSAQRMTGDAAATFQGYIPRTYNWGISLNRERYNARVNWNYRGKQRVAQVSGTGIEPGVFQWWAKRLYIDVTGEFKLTKRFALFASLRNVGDATEDFKIFGPNTPDYATFRQREDFASLWTMGVKATF
jgi:iron complex outermembrane recepter protein